MPGPNDIFGAIQRILTTPLPGQGGGQAAPATGGSAVDQVLNGLAAEYTIPGLFENRAAWVRQAQLALEKTNGDVKAALAALAGAAGLKPIVAGLGPQETAGAYTPAEQEMIDKLADANRPGADIIPLSQLQQMGVPQDQLMTAFLRQFGITQPTAGRYDTAADTSNAAANMLQALTQQEAQREAARQNVVGNQQSAFENQYAPLNYGLNLQNAATSQGNSLTSAYNALTGAQYQSGVLQGQAGNLLANLAQAYGGLANTQYELGLNLLGNPRNAIPALLMSAGQQGRTGFENFNVSRLLGIDPAQIAQMFNQAIAAANAQLTTAAQPPPFNLQAMLSGLQAQAAAAAAAAPRFVPAVAPDRGAAEVNRPAPVAQPAQQPAPLPAPPRPTAAAPSLVDALNAALTQFGPEAFYGAYTGSPGG